MEQATFHDTASNTNVISYKTMEKFESRDNESIQILLSNSNGMIEVSRPNI